MGFLKNGKGFDWNGNGKKDGFDYFMDKKVINEIESNETSNSKKTKKNKDKKLLGITMGGKPLYDATKDSNGVIIIKCLLVTILCFGGMAIPVIADMEILGSLLCIFGGLGLSILILKNT